MANHAHVKTKKHMTAAKVQQVLDNLNHTIFCDCLIIEQFGSEWSITVADTSDQRSCWLNNRSSFEIRHGGGSNFMWWVDSRIQDEIARVFDGTVRDDGIGDDVVRQSWGTPNTFREYVDKCSPTKTRLERFFILRFYYFGCSRLYLKRKKKTTENN